MVSPAVQSVSGGWRNFFQRRSRFSQAVTLPNRVNGQCVNFLASDKNLYHAVNCPREKKKKKKKKKRGGGGGGGQDFSQGYFHPYISILLYSQLV